MEDYDIMDSLAELNGGEADIANALGLINNQSFNESYSSYTNTLNDNETAFDNRVSKQTKTTNSYMSPISSPTSQFLSFDQSNSSPKRFYTNLPKDETIQFTRHLVSEDCHQSYSSQHQMNNSINKRPYSNNSNNKTPAVTKDHILAERKRREKLSQRFIALSAIVPGLKKVLFRF